MRLPENHKRRLAWGTTLALAACATPALAGHGAPALPQARVNGPSADFPVVVGEAYSAGGATFVPADTMNFDAVGYATVGAGGSLVSAAHHTLPVPSYVEVTSLASGRTILVRVDRRGPMDSANLIELSPAAAAQLGIGDNGGVRVRRVNPPEAERALLRAGAQAPERIATPKALLAVLNRKLDPQSIVTLARAGGNVPPGDDDGVAAGAPAARNTAIARAAGSGAPLPRLAKSGPATRVAASGQPAPAPKTQRAVAPAIDPMLAGATAGYPAAGADYARFAPPAPVAPRAKAPQPRPAAVVRPAPEIVAEAPAPATGAAIRSGMLVVQAGAFAVRGNAQTVANRLGAKLSGDGKVWRVRVGPFASRDQAEAALAKVHAAGYSQARIQRTE